jgi:DNA-binding response OmpR family regulator
LELPPEKNSPSIGLRLLEFLKGHLPHSRVLIMTSHNTPDIRTKCAEAGADDFFDKPFEIEELLASICRLTPVHRLELFAQII